MSADAKSMWDLMQMFKRKLMPLDLSQSDNARKLKKNLDTILGSWTSVTLVTNAISQSKALEEVLKTLALYGFRGPNSKATQPKNLKELFLVF